MARCNKSLKEHDIDQEKIRAKPVDSRQKLRTKALGHEHVVKKEGHLVSRRQRISQIELEYAVQALKLSAVVFDL